MKIFFMFVLSLVIMTMFTACGGGNDSSAQGTNSAKQESTESKKSDSKILVAYFSRTGDNYEVGFIEKGNTAIVAEMIAEKTGADIFEIKPAKPYPQDYRECTEVAKAELEVDARPEIVGKVENMSQYETIFLGYPIWWSELPMPVYTFLESNDFKGKTIIPFCTSAGNYMTGKEENIPHFAKGSKIREGIGIKGKLCQDNPEEVRKKVDAWLTSLNF